jgi:hypothetical protein
VSCCLTAISLVSAQDPADGWMAYAVGSIPDSYDRITRLEMTWTVNSKPEHGLFAFFSPWFGMDPYDNLNLIQPVNPWSGGSWSMYTEYFQWSPERNSNSDSHEVEPGQTLHGSLVYDESSDSYTLTQEIVETGVTSSQVVKCQSGKKYTVPYVVYEKTFPCRDYPPDEKVTFKNITIECDGQDCRDQVKWEAKVKDSNCNMEAHIIDSSTISITWDTSLSSKYDHMSREELFALNRREGDWTSRLTLPSNSFCENIDSVFQDMHDGDRKHVIVKHGTLTILPDNNSNETWVVKSDLDVNACTATVDFNVPGKPNPPPLPLLSTISRLESSVHDNGLAIVFTDPTGTIVPSKTQPLNAWIKL